jgi:hypothetical protein
VNNPSGVEYTPPWRIATERPEQKRHAEPELPSSSFGDGEGTMTRSLTCVTFVSLMAIDPTWAQPLGPSKTEKLNPAPMEELHLARATATEEKGELLVWISQRSLRLGGKHGIYVWSDPSSYILGDQVVAFSQAGKPLDKKAVGKALTKTTSVPYFYSEEDEPGPPDPVYREAFREDAVFLVIRAKVIRKKPPGNR